MMMLRYIIIAAVFAYHVIHDSDSDSNSASAVEFRWENDRNFLSSELSCDRAA
jgi:hypothetical protein